MVDISKLTKDEMVNYLYVRDVIRGGDNTEYAKKINYIDIMLYCLPVLLFLIFILVIYLVFKGQYGNVKKDTNEKNNLNK